MFTERQALFLYAETAVHVGSGEALGAIDLAIQRERVTDFPTAYATGIKGAIRAWFRDEAGVPDRIEIPDHASEAQAQAARAAVDTMWSVFGPDTEHAQENAGAVAFTDARLLLFPVRSVAGVFAWTTCPFALGRLARDLDLGPDPWGIRAPGPEQAAVSRGSALTVRAPGSDRAKDRVVLEDYALVPTPADADAADPVEALADWLVTHAVPDPTDGAYAWHREHLAAHLVVLPDDVFRDFVRHATEVQARVKLGPHKTTDDGGNLFYQENLPAESLLYALALAADGRRPGHPLSAEDVLRFLLHGDPAATDDARRGLDGARLQIGGDETTGKGIVHARFALRSATPPA